MTSKRLHRWLDAYRIAPTNETLPQSHSISSLRKPLYYILKLENFIYEHVSDIVHIYTANSGKNRSKHAQHPASRDPNVQLKPR